jgi:DUF971 family protein
LPGFEPSHKRGDVAPPRPPDATSVQKLTEVGRYALGVVWGDGHDSILPFRNLRRACPCEVCAGASAKEAGPEGERLARVEVLGGRSLFLRWGDGHETLLLVEEVRELCRCARCVGEPEYPISGR